MDAESFGGRMQRRCEHPMHKIIAIKKWASEACGGRIAAFSLRFLGSLAVKMKEEVQGWLR